MSKYLPDFAGVFCLVIFLISITTIDDGLLRDGDSFWHIKVGTVMLEQQSLIDSDIFSHTAFGTPWTAHEWLSEIIMAGVYKLAGLEGIFCFFLLITSLSFWLLFKLAKKNANEWVAFGCVSVAVVFSTGHMAARPHLFTWLLLVITLSILTTGEKQMYWLPLITLLWANLHGGFILSLVLQMVFIVGYVLENHLTLRKPFRETLRQQKKSAFILLICVLACGVNPFGYELLLFPFQVSKGAFSTLIGEWQSPNLQKMWYFRFYLASLVLLVSLARSRVTWPERLLILFFLNAALTHIRHISLMLIALTPPIAKMMNDLFASWRTRIFTQGEEKQLQMSAWAGPVATISLAITLILAGAIDHRSLKALAPKKIFNVESKQLTQLVSYLDKNLPAGNMYNEYSLGGYLLYALTPPPKVFIDGRADMYGEQIISDYNKIQLSGSERENLLDIYNINWVVFDKDSALIMDLSESELWQKNFENDYYAVLTRKHTNNNSRKAND